MHKNFSFKGVVRSNDNILADDGECLELVNMRTVNGALRPISEFVENTPGVYNLIGIKDDDTWKKVKEAMKQIVES